ncbi:MAG: hypothetical protein PHT88_03485 [Candidatus Moranbacteria bacterium]|nr:hypothetical protein [Candidatus Moranbacteria bacterium]
MARIKEVPHTTITEMRKAKSVSSPASEAPATKRFGMKIFGKLFLILIFIGAVGAAGYFYYQYRKVTKNDQSAETAALVKELGSVMELPTDETPTLATVTDKEKLSEQPFFKKAENNDKVLIYVKAGRAILYRPAVHKIVDVSTINVTNDQQSGSASENANKTSSQAVPASSDVHPTLALYNGAKTLGLTYKVEEQIKASFSNVDVAKKEPAAQTNYVKTVVVDVSGKYNSVANDIAKNLSAEVKSLPDGESKPDTDILVIIGEDKS